MCPDHAYLRLTSKRKTLFMDPGTGSSAMKILALFFLKKTGMAYSHPSNTIPSPVRYKDLAIDTSPANSCWHNQPSRLVRVESWLGWGSVARPRRHGRGGEYLRICLPSSFDHWHAWLLRRMHSTEIMECKCVTAHCGRAPLVL